MDDLGTIEYRQTVGQLAPQQLTGFFSDWANPPSPAAHLRALQGSHAVELAIDSLADRVVGFCNALSDGALMAHIPLLEVLPGYRGRGIGKALMVRMLARLDHLYGIDVVCDPEVAGFYEDLGMKRLTGMVMRDLADPPGVD